MKIAERRALYKDEDAIIADAVRILTKRLKSPGAHLGSPGAVKALLLLQTGALPHEEFRILFLDAKNRLIACDCMFTGTLTHTSVYPREVVKRALAHNAASVILAHNHPSGHAEASPADLALTKALKAALALVDVAVLDHLIVGGEEVLSMAEQGAL
jgi:DNA repair protein RadC